jgi:arabinogalactan endo-1,4-beta-galactosidase
MKVLLDFHYSDDWTDPGKQKVPAAWLSVVDNQIVLGDSLYNYTGYVLNHLLSNNLVPEYVQVGNEINAEILQDPSKRYNNINWNRNAFLINKGIQAVRDFASESGKDIEVMLHIAQPENAIWWFENAVKNGITDFDLIGLSYYPLWSTYKLDNLPEAINVLKIYNKEIMVVETAYPFTLNNADGANNILGSDALIDGYPASEIGQFKYLEALVETLDKVGAKGMIYWEPAWISTDCRTQWGQGSHWDNATLFNQAGGVNKGMDIYRK